MKKARGRPRKPVQGTFLGCTFILADVDQLSRRLAKILRILPSAYTEELARLALQYDPMRELKEKAPLKRKLQGRRPEVHHTYLIDNCAILAERHNKIGITRQRELKRISGGKEVPSIVFDSFRAILKVNGINHPQSLRQQARNALLVKRRS